MQAQGMDPEPIDMDETPALRIRGHHHTTPELPRRWIVLPQEVRAKATGHPLLHALLPSHVGFFPDAARHHIARPLGVAQAIFKYCVGGTGWCEIDGRRHEVRAGDLMVVPPRVPHAYGSSAARPWTVHWFHAMGEHVEPLLAELGVGRTRPVISLGVDPRLVALFQELEPILDEDCGFPCLLYASQVLTHLMGVMIRLRARAPTAAPNADLRVLQTTQDMEARLTEAFDVARLAALAQLSTSHYASVFRRMTGLSPRAYFTQLRLHRAARLLRATDESVAAIARKTGYEDALHFSRRFRQAYGVAPSEYREDRRRGR